MNSNGSPQRRISVSNTLSHSMIQSRWWMRNCIRGRGVLSCVCVRAFTGGSGEVAMQASVVAAGVTCQMAAVL